jgi:tetratricopeptide (TPR) repeat protein
VKARLCRAKVYEQKGEIKQAYDDYKRALSYEPNNAQARRYFVCLIWNTGLSSDHLGSGMDRLQEAVDKLEEEKLIEITIPDVILSMKTQICFTKGSKTEKFTWTGNSRKPNHQIQPSGSWRD